MMKVYVTAALALLPLLSIGGRSLSLDSRQAYASSRCHPEDPELISTGQLDIVFEKCPDGFVCRSHKTLQKQLDVPAISFAHCVDKKLLNLDQFCSDKLTAAAVAQNIQLPEEISSSPANYTLLDVTTCSPFDPNSKQQVQCSLVMTDLTQTRVQFQVHPCPQFDVCRKYQQVTYSDDTKSYCEQPVHALCKDRFFNIYAETIKQNLLKITPASDEQQGKIEFKFCDPYKQNKYLGCSMKYTVQMLGDGGLQHGKPREIKFQFDHITVSHHFCPQKVIRQSALSQRDAQQSYLDTTFITSGPQCRQFTPSVMRCTSRPSVRSNPQAVQKLRSSTTADIFNQMFQLGEFVHICADKDEPGQYCLPGSPEIGIICPQGKAVTCPRPFITDPNNWNDLGQAPRCVQNYGPFPGFIQDDPFRLPLNAPFDMFTGVKLKQGHYAQCKSMK
ncbi:hypothetical protein MIR68_004133 [Amoeboaphelidium protococcarum]|nr:hypothetical protein MIR68_004133 [Amoeboaphelidium protococcarum]